MADKDDNKKAETMETVEEPQAVIAFYYLPEGNPQNAAYPGVPLRDLLAHEVETMPEWVKKSIAGSAMYSADPPGTHKKQSTEGGKKG